MLRRLLLAAVLVLIASAFTPPFASAAPAVTARKLTISDPRAGRLTFDALVAGNPATARRGRLVLLLHGFPQNAETWRPMLPAIAEAGYYAVAPTMRGYSPGAKPTAAGAYETANDVRDTLAIADLLGAPRFHVVGHDWGGIVAWRLAAAAPNRVRSLTSLSTTHPSALGEATADLSTGQWSRFIYFLFFREPSMVDAFSFLDGAFAVESLKAQGLPEPQARAYTSYLIRNGLVDSALRVYRDNPLPPPWTIPATTVPTTLIWGRDDFAFGPESAALTAKYVKAPYKFVPVPGGHWVPENHPGIVLTEILSRIGSTGP